MKLAPILAVVLALTVVLSGASAVAFTKQSTAEALPTAEVIASAVPRDLVIDHRGLGYFEASTVA